MTNPLPIPDSATPHPARALLADDHPALLALAASVLEGECQVVGAVADGAALLAAAARLVFLTVHADPDFARAAFAAGAFGYVVKVRLATDLLSAVRAALAGHRFLSPTVHLDEAA